MLSLDSMLNYGAVLLPIVVPQVSEASETACLTLVAHGRSSTSDHCPRCPRSFCLSPRHPSPCVLSPSASSPSLFLLSRSLSLFPYHPSPSHSPSHSLSHAAARPLACFVPRHPPNAVVQLGPHTSRAGYGFQFPTDGRAVLDSNGLLACLCCSSCSNRSMAAFLCPARCL